MNRYDKQLAVFKKWVATAAAGLDADLSLKLWNGEVIPLGKNVQSPILLVIRSNDVITRIIHNPQLFTIFKLYAEGLFDIEGGTVLEALKRWDHLGALKVAKSLNKFEMIKTFWPFVFRAKRGTSTDDLAYGKNIETRVTHGRDDKDLIQFHYDISNAFYALFLDQNMVYSCAYFRTRETSLDQAQIDKLDMICRKLRLSPGDRLLDIGCGWGALVCHAAQHYGVKAYGVTLSQTQYDYALAKVKALGLEERVSIELRDYRHIEGEAIFDKIVQVGMFEHVGFENHDKFFTHIRTMLRPKGLYLHHAITRRATRDLKKFTKATAYQKVITRYIFPGAQLDYIGHTVTELERHGFEVHDVENWREHYQMTLERWAERLAENIDAGRAEIGETKTRLWLLYLSFFVMTFQRGMTNLFQTVASKRETGPSGLPLTREDLYR